MKTTYAFTAAVACPFSKLEHLPDADNQHGHLLVFDEDNRLLSFLDARRKIPVAGNVPLADDKAVREAKDWIAKQVAAKVLSQVDQEPSAADGPTKPAPQAAQAARPTLPAAAAVQQESPESKSGK